MTKKIYLSGLNGSGKFTLVDDEVYEYLSKWLWHLGSDGYVKRARRKEECVEGNRKDIIMHREILSVEDGKYVDHINGDKLDNRSINLRECTNQQNQWNQAPRNNVSSKYKGVTKRKYNYEACCTISNKITYLGKFTNEIAAANAYNYYALKEYGEFARLNDVPHMSYQEWNSFKCKLNNGKSKYKGVHWSKKAEKWEANLYINKKQKFLGYFDSEEDAVKHRNQMINDLNLDKSKIQTIK